MTDPLNEKLVLSTTSIGQARTETEICFPVFIYFFKRELILTNFIKVNNSNATFSFSAAGVTKMYELIREKERLELHLTFSEAFPLDSLLTRTTA